MEPGQFSRVHWARNRGERLAQEIVKGGGGGKGKEGRERVLSVEMGKERVMGGVPTER